MDMRGYVKLEASLKAWELDPKKSFEDVLSAIYDAIEDGVNLFVPIYPDRKKLKDFHLATDGDYALEIKCIEDEDGLWFCGYTSKEVTRKDGHEDVIELPLASVLETAYWVGESKGIFIYGKEGFFPIIKEMLEHMLDALGMIQLGDLELDKGVQAYEEGDFKVARMFYEQAAAKGNITAMSNLGYIYYYGRDVEVDKQKAHLFWEEAAKGGDVCGTYKLGDMYRNGDLAENIALSNELYIKAFMVAKENKDIYSYPDVILRLLKHMPNIYHKEERIRLAKEAIEGFEARIAQGDPFTKGLLEKMKKILKEIEG